VTTTDYQTGHFATIKIEDQTVKKYDLDLSSDAVAKTINHKIYVINRLGQDNITIFSPEDFSSPLIQFSTGNGSNPHDIVLVSDDKAYITLYEKGYLLVVNPNTGAELKRVDISSYADSDGIPEADQMIIIGNIVYITLLKLDRAHQYQPAANGEILMIDKRNDSIVGSIKLAGQNPYDIAYSELMNKLIISETGSFYDLTDGGIETIDLDIYQPSGLIISEVDLGGNITEFAMKPSSSQGYIIVTDSSYNTSIVSFDLEQAIKLKDILKPNMGFIYSGIAVTEEKLLVGDRSVKNPGVRIISTVTDEEITTKPIDTGLPPFSITVY
jgi:outer membrane protein assembly factor BamB